jgi:signal transduction histidine kinase
VKTFHSLTHRFMLFLTAVLVVFVAGALLITSSVVENGMVDLYRQRLERVSDVLDQYTTVRYFSKATELEAVLTSPRFSAAIETGDSGTIALEAPFYRRILNTDMLLLTDDANNVTALAGDYCASLIDRLPQLFSPDKSGINTRYVVCDDQVFEFMVSDIINYEGRLIGHIAAGGPFSNQLVDDLGRLTGFDVIVMQQDRMVGHTATDRDHGRWLATLPDQIELVADSAIRQQQVGGHEIIYSAVASPYDGATVVFVGSLDRHVTPILRQTSLFLILLVAGGGCFALAIVYLFTNRRIGRQVTLLVEAAERIARDDFAFQITPQSRDELGYLAGEFEQMRARIVENRAELEKAQEVRLQSERLAAMGQLVAGIVHDFKNPMSIIRGTTEMIGFAHKDDSKLHSQCDTIAGQVDRMLDLTRDILEYSRGRTALDVSTVTLRDYFADIQAFHAAAFQEKGVHLTVEESPNLHLTLDPGRFRRVIDNIVNNAREALTPGDRVSISWTVSPTEVSLQVNDNGPGIPESIRETIFDPFVTSGKKGGTGLGLAIARKIVEDHGARIELHSTTGQGTTFTILLPIKLVTQPVEPEPVPETSHV